MSFDIYFSPAQGFGMDFSFLHFWMPTEAVVTVLVLVLALRVRKIVKDKQASKRASVETISDFDWSN